MVLRRGFSVLEWFWVFGGFVVYLCCELCCGWCFCVFDLNFEFDLVTLWIVYCEFCRVW